MKVRRGIASASRRASATSRPRRQLSMSVSATAPTSSGNQPPCGILVSVRDQERRVQREKSAATGATRARGHFHMSSAAVVTRTVVTSMSPATAIPYAFAGCPNSGIRKRVPARRRQAASSPAAHTLVRRLRRMSVDVEPRQCSELDRLLDECECTRNYGLARDHGCRRRQDDDSGTSSELGNIRKNGLIAGARDWKARALPVRSS